MKQNLSFIKGTTDAIQELVESLSDEERRAMGGIPGTPYVSDDAIDEIAKRFVYRDENEKIIGFLDLHWVSIGTVSVCVAVRHDAQNNGVASSLMEDMISWLDESLEAATLGIGRINWFARKSNPASIHLAIAHGFIERDDYVNDAEWWGGIRNRHDYK